jgi:hypothetical protein
MLRSAITFCESWEELRKGDGSFGNGLRVDYAGAPRKRFSGGMGDERRLLGRVGRDREPIDQLGDFEIDA